MKGFGASWARCSFLSEGAETRRHRRAYRARHAGRRRDVAARRLTRIPRSRVASLRRPRGTPLARTMPARTRALALAAFALLAGAPAARAARFAPFGALLASRDHAEIRSATATDAAAENLVRRAAAT